MINLTNFHLGAYFASVVNGAANVALTIVPDGILTPSGTTAFILPRDGRLRFAWGGSANLQRLRLNTPAMRYVGLPFLAPVNVGLTVPSPPNLYNPSENGPFIPQADQVSVEATQGGGVAENVYCIVGFQFSFSRNQPGPSYRIRFTSAITQVAGTWTGGGLTPDATLPAGIYSIVGLDVQGANVTAGRLIIPGVTARPGCIARNALTSVAHPLFTSGDLGEFGQFDSVNVPNGEVFSTGGGAAQEWYMDVVRVGGR